MSKMSVQKKKKKIKLNAEHTPYLISSNIYQGEIVNSNRMN